MNLTAWKSPIFPAAFRNFIVHERNESKMRANLPKGVGGGQQNMAGMIRQAQKMQEQMEALQEQLDAREYEVKAGGGMVTLKINGKKELLSLDINPEIVDPDDIETLSDILIAGFNEAVKRVDETNKKEMSAITGDMNIPGIF